MNLNSEQIRPDLSLEEAPDQVLTTKQQQECLEHFLGEKNCSVQNLLGHRVFVYSNKGNNFVLLHRAVTYLGGNGQHPIYKKRVQLPLWYKEMTYFKY